VAVIDDHYVIFTVNVSRSEMIELMADAKLRYSSKHRKSFLPLLFPVATGNSSAGSLF